MSFLPIAAEVLSLAPRAEVVVLGPPSPRTRFLAACLRLESDGCTDAAAARRIYAKSDLADEIALPDVEAAGRILRILAWIDRDEARDALAALGDMPAPQLGEAA